MGIQTFENNTKHLADLKNDPCPKRFCTYSVVNDRLQTLDDDIIQLSDNRTKSFSFHLILTKKKMKVEKFNSTLITFGKLVLFSLQMKIVKLKGITGTLR